MNVKILPADWNENDATLDNAKSYSLLKIDLNLSGFIMGRSPCGCYAIAVNPRADDFYDRFFDFIRYENAHSRQVLVFSPDFDVHSILDIKIASACSAERSGDPQYAVHSTLLTFYEQIMKDGCLKSTARLRKEGIRREAIGFSPLGEPEDYLDYIMFAPLDGASGSEMVVNSHLRGEACFDPEAPYTPQARMYFNARKMIADGKAVRDGVHFLKVHEVLHLPDYKLLTVFENDVALPAGKEYWTPASFSAAANDYFFDYVKNLAIAP